MQVKNTLTPHAAAKDHAPVVGILLFHFGNFYHFLVEVLGVADSNRENRAPRLISVGKFFLHFFLEGGDVGVGSAGEYVVSDLFHVASIETLAERCKGGLGVASDHSTRARGVVTWLLGKRAKRALPACAYALCNQSVECISEQAGARNQQEMLSNIEKCQHV